MNGSNVKYINPVIPNTYQTIDRLIRAEKLKYAFSHDRYNPFTNKIVKNFFNVEHLSDVKNIVSEDKHIYELAYKTIRKLYFDFDKLRYTIKEARLFINKFVEHLNTELKITIKTSAVMVLKNDKYDENGKETDMINSLHIIISDFKMNITEMWDLAKYINYTYELDIDVNVYKKNQQFRLWRQSKMAKKIKLVNFYVNCGFDLRKSLINDTANCKMVSFNKTINITDYYKTLDDQKKAIQLPKEKLFELILNGQINTIPSQSSKEKLYEGTITSEQITFDREQFFNTKNSNDWKTIAMLVKKFPHLCSLDTWNKESVRLSNNPAYTYEANEEYCSKINIEDVRSGYTKLYKLISSYCVSHNIYDAMDYMKDYVRVFLASYYDEDTIRQIADKIVNYQTTDKIKNGKVFYINSKGKFTTNDGKDSFIDVKTGFITIDNDAQTVCNMYNDNLPRKYESIFTEIKDISEAKTELLNFLSSKKKVFTLLSKWGTGKTHIIIKRLIRNFVLAYTLKHGKPPKILMVTESNGLNNKLLEDFTNFEIEFGHIISFVSHLDAQKDSTIDLSRCNNVICSIQSIGKSGDHYDLIIVDEYESVCSSYSASATFKGTTPNIAFNTLLNLIKKSEKVLICDADISEDKVELLKMVIEENDMVTLKNKQSAFTEMDINIVIDKKHFTDLLINSVFEQNKKIAVASATRKYVEAVFDEIVKLYKEIETTPIKKIMRIDVNGIKVFHGATEIPIEKSKDDILKDIESFITEHQIDLFLYSPTIKTGLSINIDYFNQTFGYTSSYSVLFNEMLQMMFRNRRLKDDKLNMFLFIDEREFKCGVNKSIAFIKDHQHIKTLLFKQLIASKANERDNVNIYTPKECSDEYYQLQSINNRNKFNSKYNYASNLIHLLQYHNLNYKYITTKTYEVVKSEYDIDMDAALKTLKEKKLSEWLATELLDYDDYIERADRPVHSRNFTKSLDGGAEEIYSETIKNSYNKTFTVFALFKIKEIVDKYKSDIDERKPYTPFNKENTAEQIKNIIENHINGYNNERFYTVFIEDNHQKNAREIFRLLSQNTLVQNNLGENVKEMKYADGDDWMVDITCVERIIKLFAIYDMDTKIFTPKIITNNEFTEILSNNIELINAIYNDAINKTDITFDIDNKQHVKAVYHYIKHVLQIIDISVSYVDYSNTSRPTDKMRFDNPKSFYKYDTTTVHSTTLAHLKDYSNPITITLNKSEVYTIKELTKLLKRKKHTISERNKIQRSLFFHELDYVDSGISIIEMNKKIIKMSAKKYDFGSINPYRPPTKQFIEWRKDYNPIINKTINYKPNVLINKNVCDCEVKCEYGCDKIKFNINDVFYSPLLNIKTIDDNSVMIHDKHYKIHNKKKDRICIVMDTETHKTEPLYKNRSGNYRPYDATVPTINTIPNSYYEETLKKQNERSNEECCECEEEEQLSYFSHNIQHVIKDFCGEYPICDKAKEFITESDEPYLYYKSLLEINEPLVTEIKNKDIYVVS